MSEALPELTYDRIVPGEIYAEREIDVSPEAAAAYAAAVGAKETPAFLMAASWTVPRVSFSRWRVPPGGIHARQTWQNFRPIPGGKVRLRTAAREKFHSKSRPYVVFESVIEDGAGVLLAKGEMTILWPK